MKILKSYLYAILFVAAFAAIVGIVYVVDRLVSPIVLTICCGVIVLSLFAYVFYDVKYKNDK